MSKPLLASAPIWKFPALLFSFVFPPGPLAGSGSETALCMGCSGAVLLGLFPDVLSCHIGKFQDVIRRHRPPCDVVWREIVGLPTG